MPRASLLLVLALVVAGALVYLELAETPASDPLGAAPDDQPGEVPVDPLTAPELLGRGETLDETPLEAPGAESAPAPAKPTHVLVGTVGGLQPGEARATRVEVRALQAYGWVNKDTPPLAGNAHADGTYEMDVSALFAVEEPPTQIQATYDHPDYALLKTSIQIRDGRPRGPDGPIELRADATLERALVVEGRVVSDTGDPLEGITVALLERDAGEYFRLDAIGETVVPEATQTKADGRYRLRSAKPGTFLVAAFSKTHLPAGREVVLRNGERAEPVELRVLPGVEIAGRVTVNGKPLVKARVEAARLGKDPEFRFDFHSFVWREGRLLPGEQYAETDEEGRYVIRGLDVGPRRVKLAFVPDVYVWWPLQEGTQREVEAPDDDVDIPIEAVELEVQVLSGGEPVQDGAVTILKPGREQGRNRTSQGSSVRVVLPADETFQAKVTHARYEEQVHEFRTQGPGTSQVEVVDLGPPLARATLVVTLKDTAGVPIRRASLILKPVDEKTHFGFGMGKVLKSAEGLYRLEDLESGRKALFVLPDRSDMEFFGYRLTLREEIELIVGRETRLELTAARGGRLRVAVRDEEGNLLDAQATLQDARGTKLHVVYVSGGDNFASMSSGGPGTGSPSTVEPPLEPGEYRIELSFPGRETKRLDVKVEVGKTTEVDVTLRKL